MLRKELQDHEDNKCPNRRVQCQYCTLEGMHKEITDKSHLDECVGFTISCLNNCEHEIQRKNLADHQKVCPLEPVKCPFFAAGCTNTEHHLELVMTETVTLKHKAEAEKEAANTTKDQLQQLSLKFDGLAFCVTKQLGTIDSNPGNTQAAIKNIKSFLSLGLETMTTMLAPGDTRYYLPLVKESQYRARSASFYIKPGYKMYMYINGRDTCRVYLEKGEHDHQLKWPMSEMEIELSTEMNKILYRAKICTRCGYTVNRLEGDSTERANTRGAPIAPSRGVLRDFVFLTIKKHLCTGILQA